MTIKLRRFVLLNTILLPFAISGLVKPWRKVVKFRQWRIQGGAKGARAPPAVPQITIKRVAL